MPERESGWYKVKVRGKWRVLELSADLWWECGIDFPIAESNIDEIGERIKMPDDVEDGK